MGWFSDKEISTAGIGITHLYDKLPESPIKAAVLNAIRNDGSIVDNAIAARDSSLRAKLNYFNDYAKNFYPLGLPVSAFPSICGNPCPIIRVKENGVNVIDSAPSLVKSTEKALAKLSLTLSNVADVVKQAPSTVDDVYIMFAGNVLSTEPSSLAYFYMLFELLYNPSRDATWWTGMAVDAPPYFSHWGGNFAPRINPIESQVIAFGGEVQFALEYATISKRSFSGVIGSVGTCNNSYVPYTHSLGYDVLPIYGFDGILKYYAEFDKIIFRKQVNPSTVTEYTIHGLNIRNRVRTSTGYMSVLHTPDGFSSQATGGTLNGSVSNFVLPVFKDLFDALPTSLQDQFVSETLIVFVQSIDSTTISWYQKGFFSELIIFASQVISVFFSTVTVNVSAGLTNLITQAVIAVLLGAASSLLYQILSPSIGGSSTATILGIAATVALSYAGASYLNIQGLPLASSLLESVSALVNSFSKDEKAELNDDIAKFNEATKGNTAILDRGVKLLKTSSSSMQFDALATSLNYAESPEEFYNRTIHQGNIGLLSIEAVSNYTKNKLDLTNKPIQLFA